MSRMRTRVALFSATTLAATAAVATFTVGSSTASPDLSNAPTVNVAGRDAAAKHKGISINGAVEDRGPISRPELEAFTQRTMKMKYQTSGGEQSHRYTGPLLLDVLNSVEPNFSSDKHDPLRFVFLVKATDGFLAALAWGEIDPELANKRAIIALTEDGTKLDRPRLVLPGDHHGARQVYDVATISLLRLTPNMANGAAGKQEDHADVGHNH